MGQWHHHFNLKTISAKASSHPPLEWGFCVYNLRTLSRMEHDSPNRSWCNHEATPLHVIHTEQGKFHFCGECLQELSPKKYKQLLTNLTKAIQLQDPGDETSTANP